LELRSLAAVDPSLSPFLTGSDVMTATPLASIKGHDMMCCKKTGGPLLFYSGAKTEDQQKVAVTMVAKNNTYA
jgi:hypothetical protein